MPKTPPTTTVAAFLAGLPAERRRDVTQIRAMVRAHLPKGYEEVVTRGMLIYQVPFAKYSDTYNGQPLWYVGLTLGKSMSLHILPLYWNEPLTRQLQDGFKKAGKKLDMGKACVRFKTVEDLPLDAIGEIVESVPMDQWIAIAKAATSKGKKNKK